jgi:sterol desaturase/sphingolipid hydroxylase (fatty acid hydroxylase superfamily)
VRNAVQVIPFLVLAAGTPAIAAFNLFLLWHARLYHANVRTNLGVLRYVVVTPQSHRVHHSVEARHHDKNFGAFLSVWDRLFKTHYIGDDDEYPATGLPTPGRSVAPVQRRRDALVVPILQLGLPFVSLAQRAVGRRQADLSRAA